MLLEILRNRRAGPVHQVQIDVIRLQILQRGRDAILDTLVPRVIELGSDPNLFARHTRVDNSLANLRFVTVSKGTGSPLEKGRKRWDPSPFLRIDMAVASQQSVLDCHANFVGLRLPGAETDTGHLRAGVQSEHRPENICVSRCVLVSASTAR
jgi:hypothetical protein